MSNPHLSSAHHAGYHSGMLLVRARASAAGPLAALAERSDALQASPGIAALEALERSGRVRQVVAIARQSGAEPAAARRRGGMLAMSNLSDAVRPEVSTDPNAGVSLIQLDRDQDTEALQTAISHDPHFSEVSRIPIRYALLPDKKRRKSRKETATSAQQGGTIARSAPSPSSMWNLTKIRWEIARALPDFRDADEVRVAVLDSGIDRDHPDLKDEIQSYVYDDPGLDRASSERDLIGHGTHVAGTIAAAIDNAAGVNGICRCSLHAWKIFDDVADYDPFSQSYVYYVNPVMYLRALAQCLADGMDVINLSIGGPMAPDFQERQLFNQLLAEGATIVAAMGNERRQGSPTSYPAAIGGVIAVGATKVNDAVADFSNRGRHISLSAPGVGIWSTLPTYPGQFGFAAEFDLAGNPREGRPDRRDVDYDAWDGTSMATPHVAAAAALLLAKRGSMTGAQVREALTQSADPVSGMGGDPTHPDYGAGRLNLEALLR